MRLFNNDLICSWFFLGSFFIIMKKIRVKIMTNELIAVLFIIVNFTLVMLSYKLFGRTGLYAYIVMSVIAANIQVSKTTTVFGITTTLGNTMYSGIFLATDLLSEKYGKKAATSSVLIGFFTQLSFLIVTQFSLWFKPDPSDWAQPYMEGLFSLALPVFTIAGLLSFIVSQVRRIPVLPNLIRFIKSKKGLNIERSILVLVFAISRINLFIELNGENATMPLISASVIADTLQTL